MESFSHLISLYKPQNSNKMKRIAIAILLLVGSMTNATAQKDETLLKKGELTTKIDKLTKQYSKLDIFSGVVLVAENGNPLYHKAFGLANRSTKETNTIKTKFDIGSMNKTFTHMVLLQLWEQGLLKFEDKLGMYLEGFSKEAAEKITINQLVNHTSGIGDYVGADYFDLKYEDKTIEALVERIKKLPLLFEPGTEDDYSNSGFILLGAIIEKVTGKSYHQNVIERIIEPLKLKETYVINGNEVPNYAIGYYKDMKGKLLDNGNFEEVPSSAGGFYATASDMLTFYREFHYGTKILKHETKMQDEFFSMIQEHNQTGGAIPHAGGWNGANTVHYEILRDKISILVFANMDEPVAEQLGAGILAIVRGKDPKSPSLPAVQNVYQAYTKHGIAYVKDHFYELISNFHPTDPKGLILNQIGYSHLREKQMEKAIAIFQLNTALFPEDANLWDSLGEAYFKKGNREKALEYYSKALKLDPEMPSAKEMVRKLKN